MSHISPETSALQINSSTTTSDAKATEQQHTLKYELDINATEDVPTDIASVKSIEVASARSTLRFKLQRADQSPYSGNARLEQFTIKFLGHFVFKEGIPSMDYQSNTLTIDQSFDSSGIIEIPIYIDEFLSLPEIDSNTHTIPSCKRHNRSNQPAHVRQSLADSGKRPDFHIASLRHAI